MKQPKQSASAFTPGPWKVDGAGVKAPSGHVVAECLNLNSEWDSNSANANLIAAAPEMLEALKCAEANLSHRQGDCYSNDYMGVCVCGLEVVQRAIAKAEGRE